MIGVWIAALLGLEFGDTLGQLVALMIHMGDTHFLVDMALVGFQRIDGFVELLADLLPIARLRVGEGNAGLFFCERVFSG